jgi:Putative beta-lactamase-inhibitor-like, PepSY-like
MKTTILVCLVSLMASLANAQKLKESEVPEAVKKAFVQKFKDAKEVKWSRESPTEFEAEFEVGKMEQSANFDNAGKWLVTETEIKSSELPHSVQAAIAKEYAAYKIEEAEKVESADHGTLYEVELKNGKLKYEVQLSAEGEVLKKEEVKEKAEKKKD